MTATPPPPGMVDLPVDAPIWDRFFTVAPLVLVGTTEGDGYDLAPKHMVMPLGWSNYFCFACSPRHGTYRNAEQSGEFTVSFLRPGQVVDASLAAAPRQGISDKPSLAEVPVAPARVVSGVLAEGAYLWLECRLERLVDGFGVNSLVIGEVVAAAVAEGSERREEVDDADLLMREPLLVYTPPYRIGTVAQTYAFPLHTGFSR